MNERIKQVRKTLKLNQAEFGKRIGLKQSTITAYECGNRTPLNTVVTAICKTFGVDETWLRTGEGEMFVESPDNVVDAVAEKLDLNDFERMILSAYVQLPKQLRDEFCKCMREGLFKGNPVLTLKKSAPDKSKADDEMVYSETVAKNEQRTTFAVRKGHDTELLEEAKTRVKKVPGSDLE